MKCHNRGVQVALAAIALLAMNIHQARSSVIYWSSWTSGSIQRANLDGTNRTTLVTGQSNPVGPALDLAAGHMYWGNVGAGVIRRANLDGTRQTNVI